MYNEQNVISLGNPKMDYSASYTQSFDYIFLFFPLTGTKIQYSEETRTHDFCFLKHFQSKNITNMHGNYYDRLKNIDLFYNI